MHPRRSERLVLYSVHAEAMSGVDESSMHEAAVNRCAVFCVRARTICNLIDSTEGNVTRMSVSRSSGKADPFGLLVLAVMLALSVTIGIQAQASAPGEKVVSAPETVCDLPCVTPDRRH